VTDQQAPKTRRDLATLLSSDPRYPTKTFVLEAHPGEDSVGYLAEIAGRGNLEETGDAYLFRLKLPAVSDNAWFWVDQLDGRFWSFHTNMPHKPAFDYLSKQVGARRDLDWVWLPSEHVRNAWPGAAARQVRSRFDGNRILGEDDVINDVKMQLSGRNASVLLDRLYQDPKLRFAISFDSVALPVVDDDMGFIREGVHRMGRFAASGESSELHFLFVQRVVDRYKRLVTLFEEKALAWTAFGDAGRDGGGKISGAPIVIQFSRPIPDIGRFVGELFSSRHPYRLWGTPRVDSGYAEVEAVDLHVGQALSMDIDREWLRIYLTEGGCGNTIARLVSNLQHSFDGSLDFVDTELKQALKGGLVDRG